MMVISSDFFRNNELLFNINHESNRVSISTPNLWSPKGAAETINKLNEILELRPQNDIQLHVKEVEKRGT